MLSVGKDFKNPVIISSLNAGDSLLEAELIRKPSLARFHILCSLDFASKLQVDRTALLPSQVRWQHCYCGMFCTYEETLIRSRGKRRTQWVKSHVTWQQSWNQRRQISVSLFIYLSICLFIYIYAYVCVHHVCAGALITAEPIAPGWTHLLHPGLASISSLHGLARLYQTQGGWIKMAMG